jgi:hypothetical protein
MALMPLFFKALLASPSGEGTGMMDECENSAGSMMRIASQDSARNPRFAVSSEIPRHVSFAFCGGEKN